jgi:hypothetical protein
MKIKNFMAGALLFSALTPAYAQTSSSSSDQDLKQQEVFDNCIGLFKGLEPTGDDKAKVFNDRQQTEKARLPLGTSGVAPAVSTAVSLVASDEDGRGLISFARSSQSTRGTQSTSSLTVSVPFNKSKGEAVFATLNGLSGDIDVSGAFSSFTWNIKPTLYGEAVCGECRDLGIGLLDCNLDGIAKKLENEKMSADEAAAVRSAFEDKIFGVSRTWAAAASVGRGERSFFASDATKQSENRLGYSASLLGGLLFPRGSLYGKVTGKRDYEDNDPATLCTPITGGLLQDCTSLPLGKAQVVDSLVSGLELRYFFQKFALAPSVRYDHESDVWGIEMPLFLVRNEKDAFTGGFKLGWRSDQHKVVAAVFVTKPLLP